MNHLTKPWPEVKLWPEVTAAVVIAVNIFITARFIRVVQSVIALQTSGAIVLPVAKSAKAVEANGNSLVLKLSADGSISASGAPVDHAALIGRLRVKMPDRVIVEAGPGVQYEQLKALLRELEAIGVKKLVFRSNDIPPTPNPSVAPR